MKKMFYERFLFIVAMLAFPGLSYYNESTPAKTTSSKKTSTTTPIATTSSADDCLSINEQVNLNLENTPFIFIPNITKTCINGFYNASHLLRVASNESNYFVNVVFNGCIKYPYNFFIKYHNGMISWLSNDQHCDRQNLLNNFYIKEKEFDLYFVPSYEFGNNLINQNLDQNGYYVGNITIYLVKDCNCVEKNITKNVILNGNNTSLNFADTNYDCEANSVCELARIVTPGYTESGLILEVRYMGCMPENQNQIFMTYEKNQINGLPTSHEVMWNFEEVEGACDVYRRMNWAFPYNIYIFSSFVSNNKTLNIPHDQDLQIELNLVPGNADIGLGIVDTDYINAIRSRHLIWCMINIGSLILALWLIIMKSSEQMKEYKFFLLNISIWSFLADFVINIIMVPISLVPAPAISVLSISDDFYNIYISIFVRIPYVGIIFRPCVLWLITLGACGTSIACAVYYRYRQLFYARTFKEVNLKKWVLPLIFLHLLPGILPWVFYLWNNTYPINIINSAEDMMVKYQHAFDLFIQYESYTIEFSSIYMYLFFIIAIVEILAYFFFIKGIGIYMLVFCIQSLKTQSNAKSNKTVQMHKQMIMAILLQSSIPFICIYLTYFTMVISITFGITHVVNLVEALFELSALHSCFNTLIMIMTIGPYKKPILSLFSKIKRYLTRLPNQVIDINNNA